MPPPRSCAAWAGAGLAAPAVAADLNVTVQIPQLDVAEYHRPYTAVWIEREDHGVAAQLAVWYAQKESKEGAGTKWLPELRQWWRRGGRELTLPEIGQTVILTRTATRSSPMPEREALERLGASGDRSGHQCDDAGAQTTTLRNHGNS